MKDVRELLPYMDADVTTFSDYSVTHQMAPAFAVLLFRLCEYFVSVVDLILFVSFVCCCYTADTDTKVYQTNNTFAEVLTQKCFK